MLQNNRSLESQHFEFAPADAGNITASEGWLEFSDWGSHLVCPCLATTSDACWATHLDSLPQCAKDADAPMDAGATNVSVPTLVCPHAQLPEARLSQ